MAKLTPTAAQTLGPFYSYEFLGPEDAVIAGPDAKGRRITLEGVLLDREAAPMRDALVEVWQADAEGRYRGRDPDADPAVKGFGRALTDGDGVFRFETVLPGASQGGGNSRQAPHFAVSLFAGGLTRRAVTRVYAPDDPALAEDETLAALGDAASTLMATWDGDTLRCRIRLAGEGATAFFED